MYADAKIRTRTLRRKLTERVHETISNSCYSMSICLRLLAAARGEIMAETNEQSPVTSLSSLCFGGVCGAKRNAYPKLFSSDLSVRLSHFKTQ